MTEAPDNAPAFDAAPLALHSEIVRPEWIDYNGHMNVAYYVLAFDHATDAFFDHVGLDEAYRNQSHASTFALEAHITYEREMLAGAPMRFTTQLLGHDAKRLHFMHFMYHGVESWLSATTELISLHVDMAARRSAPMSGAILRRLDAIAASHGKLERPKQAGRVISLER